MVRQARRPGGNSSEPVPYAEWYTSSQAKELSQMLPDPQEESLVDDGGRWGPPLLPLLLLLLLCVLAPGTPPPSAAPLSTQPQR